MLDLHSGPVKPSVHIQSKAPEGPVVQVASLKQGLDKHGWRLVSQC